MKSLLKASSSGVPNYYKGIQESSVYSSDLKFTKSIRKSYTLKVAVSKCFDCSGFFGMMPYPPEGILCYFK